MQGTSSQCPLLKHLANFRTAQVMFVIPETLQYTELYQHILVGCSFAKESYLIVKFIFLGPSNFCLVHVSLVPVLNVVGEQVHCKLYSINGHCNLIVYFWFFLLIRNLYLQKTKPTQHSVRQLRGLGLIPNLLACRSSKVCLFIFGFSFQHCWFSVII